MKPILFIADSYGSLDHERDTSLHLIKGLFEIQKDVKVYWTSPQFIYSDNSQLYTEIHGQIDVNAQFIPENTKIKLSQFHSIHWRKDPPVDVETYRLWNLLKSSSTKLKFYNSIESLSLWHEKFSTANYPEWCVPSFVSNDVNLLTQYNTQNSGIKLIAKPSGSAGSRGIEILDSNPKIANNQINKIKNEFGDWVIIQQFDETIFKTGETRVFFIGGEIVGSLKKTPHTGTEIILWPQDTTQWPKLETAELDKTQQIRAKKVAEDLNKQGVHFASIDFIEHKILEINITSPGLLKWLDENQNSNLKQFYWKKII